MLPLRRGLQGTEQHCFSLKGFKHGSNVSAVARKGEHMDGQVGQAYTQMSALWKSGSPAALKTSSSRTHLLRTELKVAHSFLQEWGRITILRSCECTEKAQF